MNNYPMDVVENGKYITVVHENDTHRISMIRDDYPEMPYNDFGCPVFRYECTYDIRPELVYGTGTGRDLARAEQPLSDNPTTRTAQLKLREIGRHVDSLRQALIHLDRVTFGSDHSLEDVFSRYLRIFHDGDARFRYPDNDTYFYHVAVNTATLREYWGCDNTPENRTAKMNEIEAYLTGDVWVIRTERKVDVKTVETRHYRDTDEIDTEATETVEFDIADTISGYYGRDNALECASEMWAELTNK